jgi:TonB family protein
MIGETLGSYKVVSEIGTGGMGVVYLVEHKVLGRKAAVKLIRSDVPKEYVERFFTEAKAAATLHHPGLVDVFDFGHHTDGRAFIVMEYLQGESLAERLEHDPRLPVPIACSIARSVATSLEVAHNEGIVHRDLKPGNIYLVPDSDAPAGVRTKVLDFGIAKLVRERESTREPRGANTQSGAVIGTPRYMSPEQCKNAKNVDGRSDVYSLGCILYEMLLGVAPFDYDSWAELVGAHIYEEPPRPTEIDPKIPADVETLVCKMLEKAPDERFQSMKELAESLEVLLRTHGVAPVRLTPPNRITPAKGTAQFSDPTLPASSKELEAIKDRRPSTGGARASTAKPITGKRATDPTINAVTGEQSTKKPPWAAIALAGGGLVALGGAAFIVLGKNEDKTREEPTYVVVDQRGSAGKPVETASDPENPAIVVDAAVMETPPPATIDAAVKSTNTTTKKSPEAELVAGLTRTFSKQNAAITACFKQHPTSVEGQVAVRFQVDTSGKVTTAEVLPTSVGATPLGTCIAAIAKRTNFGPLPQSVAFKAPLVTLEN